MYELLPDLSPMLFAHCIWVRGHSRSLIYDLQQQRGLSIPGAYTDLMALLDAHRGASLQTLLTQVSSSQPDAQHSELPLPVCHHSGPADLDSAASGRLLGLLRFLRDQGVLFCTATPERFPRLGLRFSRPGILDSALLDVDEDSEHPLESLVMELESLGCGLLVVRLKRSAPLTWLARLLPVLAAGHGMALEVYLEAKALEHETAPRPWQEALTALCTAEPRISVFHVLGSERAGWSQVAPSGFGSIVQHPALLRLDACEAPSQQELGISQELFCESQGFNTFMHRKVCITARGRIQNTVGEAPSFGMWPRDRLADTVKTAAFQDAWVIHKGMIEGCRDCELRHACIDPRLPVLTQEGDYQHTGACHYDPHRGRWR